jgi:hypothetical protein
MGRQIEEIISSLTGGTMSINANLTDIESLLTTLQADIADGVKLDNGAAASGQMDIATDSGNNAPGNGVQLGYYNTSDASFSILSSTNGLPVKEAQATSGGTGSKDFTSTSYGTIAASNPVRLGCTIYNSGPGSLHVLLGTATASTSVFSAKLNSGDYYEVPFNYTGLIGGIFATAGTAEVTELS